MFKWKLFKWKLFIYGTYNASFNKAIHNELWVLAISTYQPLCSNIIVARLMSTGWISKDSNSSTSWPSSWSATGSEYESSNFLFRKTFACLFTEISISCNRSVQFVGSRQTSMSFASNREFTSSVTWPLNVSMITRVLCCHQYPPSPFLCRKWWYFLYTYWITVSSFD